MFCNVLFAQLAGCSFARADYYADKAAEGQFGGYHNQHAARASYRRKRWCWPGHHTINTIYTTMRIPGPPGRPRETVKT